MAFQKGHSLNRGRKHTAETRKRMSEAHKGRTPWNKGIPFTEETKLKLRAKARGRKKSAEHRYKIGLANSRRVWTEEMKEKRRGANSNLWKGGLSTKNLLIRASSDYKKWRKAVYERDQYRCIMCGANRNLNADHIKPFAYYPELRFSVDNGRTLCRDCHSKTDTYLYKALKFYGRRDSLWEQRN